MAEEDSLTGGDLITIQQAPEDGVYPAQTIVIPYCNYYWNSNKEEG
jgi:hypothetical protein